MRIWRHFLAALFPVPTGRGLVGPRASLAMVTKKNLFICWGLKKHGHLPYTITVSWSNHGIILICVL